MSVDIYAPEVSNFYRSFAAATSSCRNRFNAIDKPPLWDACHSAKSHKSKQLVTIWHSPPLQYTISRVTPDARLSSNVIYASLVLPWSIIIITNTDSLVQFVLSAKKYSLYV